MEKLTVTIATCFIVCSVLLLLPPSSNIFNRLKSNLTTTGSYDSKKPREKLLGGGLLATEFDDESCLSRYHQASLRKPSPHKPSVYLVSKLRSYEKLHKRCGPGSDAYKSATEKLGLKPGNGSESVGECRYIVWVPYSGLANRIISLVSVFLYALLTERVILVDQRSGISDLFCEPFPATSWLLPRNFPLLGGKKRDRFFDRSNSHCYGTMLRNSAPNLTETSLPSYLYLYLISDYSDDDKMFFCEEDQKTFIGEVPWLVVNSNIYFVPSLWLIPSFQTELIKMFPEKETVFHHLSWYLLHPTNQVWGLVTRSYDAYLSRADERLGIQVRVFDRHAGYLQHVMDQIVACTQREKLLPELSTQVTNTSRSKRLLKVVLVTSLHPEYSVKLKRMFWEQPTSTGESIEVYQPSEERVQQTDKKLHDQKALAEVYLLSLTDNIVTTARSTFGYFAHSLGGLRPWILYKPENRTAPDPPCVKAVSMEPCFHSPPLYGCQAKTIEITPFVMSCEDSNPGLKLVDAPE